MAIYAPIMTRKLDTAIVRFDDSSGVGTLTLNRPESLNALNGQLSQDIVEGLRLVEQENEDSDGVALRAVIIEGAGDRAFCAGADISGFSSSRSGATSTRSMSEVLQNFPAPVIAKIQGYCLGGGLELAFACDFRFASEDSLFGLPEIDLGLIPGGGGAQYITKLAGPGVATEIAMMGKHISATRAKDEGLIHRVYPVDGLDDEVRTFAVDLAEKAPLAIQAIKESIQVAQNTGLTEGRRFDRKVFGRLQNTEDAKEGRTAFAEDREPEFVGR